MTETQADYAEKIRAIAPELAYSAEFVPQSQSRNKGEKALSLNWRVTLRMGSREILTCDYMQGIGHAPGYPAGGHRLSVDQAEYFKGIAEKGKRGKLKDPTAYGPYCWHLLPLDPPGLGDVLYSLLSDAEAIEYATYEEWAREMGFDADSRKGEATYRECLAVGLKLRAALGDERVTKLREALQDI